MQDADDLTIDAQWDIYSMNGVAWKRGKDKRCIQGKDISQVATSVEDCAANAKAAYDNSGVT